jgi:hypothetical protein
MLRNSETYFIWHLVLFSVISYCSTKRNISMVEWHVVQLLQNFISSSKYASNTGIDIILSSILQENIEEHPRLYHVVARVIRNCSRALDFPVKMVCVFFKVAAIFFTLLERGYWSQMRSYFKNVTCFMRHLWISF